MTESLTTPREILEPKNDYILLEEVPYEETTVGGIVLPNVVDPTQNKRNSGRFRVVAVGPGPFSDEYFYAPPMERPECLRRPMEVQVGDVITFQGTAFLIIGGGNQYAVIQSYQVVCTFRPTLVVS